MWFIAVIHPAGRSNFSWGRRCSIQPEIRVQRFKILWPNMARSTKQRSPEILPGSLSNISFVPLSIAPDFWRRAAPSWTRSSGPRGLPRNLTSTTGHTFMMEILCVSPHFRVLFHNLLYTLNLSLSLSTVIRPKSILQPSTCLCYFMLFLPSIVHCSVNNMNNFHHLPSISIHVLSQRQLRMCALEWAQCRCHIASARRMMKLPGTMSDLPGIT